jgi:hypothetical protein
MTNPNTAPTQAPNWRSKMDKKELAELIKQVEAMKGAMQIMLRQLTEISSQLKFIPVSQASSDSDEDVNDEYRAGMKP